MNVRHITALAAFLVFGTVACDPSKPELDKTKAELATVTADRDNLKSQLEQANGKVAAMQAQINELQAKAAAAAAAAAAPPAVEEKPAPGKKAVAKKAPKTAAEKKEIQKVEQKANTGAGHF